MAYVQVKLYIYYSYNIIETRLLTISVTYPETRISPILCNITHTLIQREIYFHNMIRIFFLYLSHHISVEYAFICYPGYNILLCYSLAVLRLIECILRCVGWTEQWTNIEYKIQQCNNPQLSKLAFNFFE